MKHLDYWHALWKRFRAHKLGLGAAYFLGAFILVGVYAPVFASSKPFAVCWNGTWYFPFFRYLLYSGFYSKSIDLFFNILMFTLPFFVLAFIFKRKLLFLLTLLVQFSLFFYVALTPPRDPSSDPQLNAQKYHSLQYSLLSSQQKLTWEEDLKYMSPYAQLNLIVQDMLLKAQYERLQPYREAYATAKGDPNARLPTLWEMKQQNSEQELASYRELLKTGDKKEQAQAEAHIRYFADRAAWLKSEEGNVTHMFLPLMRTFHWEDDAGGGQTLNRIIPWYERTRTNGKDLVSALIFGIRVSLVVGMLAIALALSIGVPIGAFSGYYGGKWDIFTFRMIEIWESMPTFFMLLFVVAITESKSIFLVIGIIGLFGWTGFSRFIRGEVLKQRKLHYVEACRAIGFRNKRIIFTQILPNAVPPLLTLLPFAVMGAISSEAGLSFLGLGEEGSCSWGVLMDEGRHAFPAESYLLWPPAFLLTALLVSIALVGDNLRDSLDPKSR